MSNETMKQEFPGEKKRLAVCYSKYKQKRSDSSEVFWDDGEVDNLPYILY